MRERPARPSRAQRAMPPPLHAGCALFLDIDGTLAELAPSPDAVQIDHAVVAAIPQISTTLGGALALITGRSITGADRLFQDLILPIAGQHGCERRDANGTLHLHAPAKATLAKLRKLFSDLASRHPGLLLEDKGATLALHYRQAPELASHVHRTLRSETEEVAAAGYELQPGKQLLEIRPDGRDKGTAISDFMRERPFAGRLPVFVGDDRGDEHGFIVVKRMRGWSVKVGPGRTAARYRLADIAAVQQWLLGLLLPSGTNART